MQTHSTPYAKDVPATELRILREVVEGSPQALVCIDAGGRVLVWNRRATEIFGWSSQEALGGHLSELIVPERCRPTCLDGIDRYLTTGDHRILDHSVEMNGLHREGHEVPVELTVTEALAGDQPIFNVYIEELVKDKLADAEAHRLAAIVESSDAAIIAWTLAGTVTSWNRGAERMLGFSSQEMLGSSVLRIWPADSRPLFEGLTGRLAAGESVPTFESARVAKDGTPIEVSVTLSAISDRNGRVIGASVILRDISELKRAERLLNEQRSRWDGAFHGAPNGMALVSPEGRLLAVNSSFCRLLRRDEDELLNCDFQSLTHPEDVGSDVNELRRLIEGEIDTYETEKRYQAPGGEVIWARLIVHVVREEGQPLYFVSQLHDMTAQKQSEEELVRYSEQLDELALRDPLTGLRNYRDFHAMLDSELGRAHRYHHEWSILLFDVDHFRQINRFHRVEGDRVLYAVGMAIANASRSSDLAFRIGGDEFALILPNTSLRDAEGMAERVGGEVAKAGAASLSFGAASWPVDGDSKEIMLARADMRLQAAKRQDGATPRPPDTGAMDAPSDVVHEILALARTQLGMGLAYLSETTDTSQVYVAVDGDHSSFGVQEGDALPLEASYCTRMLAGQISNAVSEVSNQPELARLEITKQARIGSYVGVPVKLANGHPWGTLCTVSHDPGEGLDERHLELMHSLARLIATQIEQDQYQAVGRRSHAELAGIQALLSALTARDQYTGAHSHTVVKLATCVALRLGLNDEQVQEVEQVALLHDIGKVGIPDSVLQKRGPLSKQDWQLMFQHPAIGARILAGTRTLAHLAPAVKAEHERFDGNGYPDGLAGQEIPLASRITFACDAYHAMTSDRPYRKALSPDIARAQLREGAGSQFDPQVVEALLAAIDRDTDTDGPSSLQSALGLSPSDVLSALTPRQTPAWRPSPAAGLPAAIGETRAVCRQCGTHVTTTVTSAVIGGTCTNCGSAELGLLSA
jgi:diguanylate cyclase (GGDEF)-like protein/PAS domain S-box-containing protein